MQREYKVFRIENGTVIDHMPHWSALRVVELLGLQDTDSLVTVGIGLQSAKMGRKDLLKVENRELTQQEINRIALVAPQATINLIREGKLADKFEVQLPDEFTGLARCGNHGCITRHEAVPPRFRTISRE
ncbi:MAG: aspartate carbamoyltransferase regulatory subunit, partial [Candidatus Eremiobacterota bacterium]